MKQIQIIPVLLVLLLALSGCTVPSGDDLLTAPKPSKNYQTLQVELEKVLATQSYAAPLSGENRSTVQLVDLNGDGTEEAVSFFKKSGNSNEFTVYIHKKTDDAYVLTGTITGSGTGIQSVDYPVITPEGRRGIVISWQLTGEGMGALTMCDFNADLTPKVQLEAECTAMELTDLNNDGAKDLLLIAGDLKGKRTARLYQYIGGVLTPTGEAPINPEAVAIESNRIYSARVADGLPAVFVEEKTSSGVGLTTDIFVFHDGVLQNLALDGEDSATRGTYRPLSVYATDINHDGITELPRAVLMAGYTDAAATDAIFMLDWYAYSVSEQPRRVCTTYQNVSEEWYFLIDDSWHSQITATKTSESGLTAVHFAQHTGQGEPIPVFSIYCATGTLRDYYAGRSDLIQLGENSKAVFFARISDSASQSSFRVTEDAIRGRFSLVTKAWSN